MKPSAPILAGAAALLLAAATPACTTEEACVSPIDDTDWESVEEFPCLGSDDGCVYRHLLSFAGGEYDWLPSDQTEAGAYDYDCDNDTLRAYGAGGELVFTATYAADEQRLTLTVASAGTVFEYQPAS